MVEAVNLDTYLTCSFRINSFIMIVVFTSFKIMDLVVIIVGGD